MSEEGISSDYFDPDALEQERFLGRVVVSRIREGSVGKLAGATVWYLEVENISRPMTFNFSKELLPAKGKNTLWARQILAWRKIGVPISERTIPTLEGKYFWFTVGDITYVDKRTLEEKILTRNFFVPVAIPTEEELDKVFASRGLTRDTTQAPEKPPWEEEKRIKMTPEQESLILSLADGKTHENFLAEIEDFEELADLKPGLIDKSLIAELIVKKKLEIKENKYVAKAIRVTE